MSHLLDADMLHGKVCVCQVYRAEMLDSNKLSLLLFLGDLPCRRRLLSSGRERRDDGEYPKQIYESAITGTSSQLSHIRWISEITYHRYPITQSVDQFQHAVSLGMILIKDLSI